LFSGLKEPRAYLDFILWAALAQFCTALRCSPACLSALLKYGWQVGQVACSLIAPRSAQNLAAFAAKAKSKQALILKFQC